MVVASSRLHAVRYHEAIKRYIVKNQIIGFDALVALSGKLTDPDDATGAERTESNFNGFPDSQTPRRFHDDCRAACQTAVTCVPMTVTCSPNERHIADGCLALVIISCSRWCCRTVRRRSNCRRSAW